MKKETKNLTSGRMSVKVQRNEKEQRETESDRDRGRVAGTGESDETQLLFKQTKKNNVY